MMTNSLKTYDFSWISQGIHTRPLANNEISLLNPYEYYSGVTNAKALLMLHGFASSPAVFRNFYPQLQNYEYVYAPLLSGHGQSISAFSKVTRNDWLTQVQSILDDLSQKYQTIDILGLSMGGLLAGYLIHNFSINHLYLLAPAFALTKPLPVLLQSAVTMHRLGFSSIANVGGKMMNPSEAELSFRQLPLTSIIEILVLIQEYHYQPWSTPTTLFLGSNDTVVSSAKVASLLKDLPNLKIHMIEQTNHVLPIDYNYQEILKTIQENQL